MKDSFLYLGIFAVGVLLALFMPIPETLLSDSISKGILYTLLFFVGIQIGLSRNLLGAVKSYGWKITMVPLATTIGTFGAAALISIALPHRSLTDCLSVGSGFAYYSLSSIIISEYRGAELGTVALISNIIREFYVLIFAPLMVRYFGNLSPICAGGATTMDTTLPVITKYSGSDFVVISLFHGMIIDFSAPFWVIFFATH